MIYTYPHPAFEQLMLGPHSGLVYLALAYGLRYQKFPDRIFEMLLRLEINPKIIGDEVFRQLDEMPSLAFH